MTSDASHPARPESTRRTRVATAALVLAGAVFCARLADGSFLADDLALLATFAHWDGSGRLVAEVLARFAGSVDGVNAFWRPLTYGTFALNYQAAGADARAWLGVNLALHLANAALVGALVERLAAGRARAAALFAGTLFFALASGWESALWIAARYDALATLFALLAGWWFAGGRSWLALAAAAAALMSKESGASALVLIGFLALAFELANPEDPATVRVRHLALRLWPFALLGLAYVGVRIVLFGQATQGYAGVSVDPFSLRHWATLLASGCEWARATFPGDGIWRWLAIGAALALAGLGVSSARESRPALLRLLAVGAASAAALSLLLPHLRTFDPSGIGGRLFYLPGAFIAASLGLALQAAIDHERFDSSGQVRKQPVTWRDCPLAMAAWSLAGALALTHLHWMWRATSEYHAIHGEMRAMAAGIAEAASAAQSPPALLLVPDALGRAPFARNAQAGLMLPPLQRTPLTRRVLVQLDSEVPDIPGKVSRGLFDWLSRHPLFEYPGGNATLPGATAVEPSAYLCWNLGDHRFRRMAVEPGERASLAKRIDDAYARAGCRGGSLDFP